MKDTDAFLVKLEGKGVVRGSGLDEKIGTQRNDVLVSTGFSWLRRGCN
jgi:hypothetical protein